MATNEQVIERVDKMEDNIMPLIRSNEKRLDTIEPLVFNHQLVLYGDPENRKDEGVIGVLNDLDELVKNIKSFVKPVAVSIVIGFLSWAIKMGLDIYLTLEVVK